MDVCSILSELVRLRNHNIALPGIKELKLAMEILVRKHPWFMLTQGITAAVSSAVVVDPSTLTSKVSPRELWTCVAFCLSLTG